MALRRYVVVKSSPLSTCGEPLCAARPTFAKKRPRLTAAPTCLTRSGSGQGNGVGAAK
jgi:hypothetical protein